MTKSEVDYIIESIIFYNGRRVPDIVRGLMRKFGFDEETARQKVINWAVKNNYEITQVEEVSPR